MDQSSAASRTGRGIEANSQTGEVSRLEVDGRGARTASGQTGSPRLSDAPPGPIETRSSLIQPRCWSRLSGREWGLNNCWTRANCRALSGRRAGSICVWLARNHKPGLVPLGESKPFTERVFLIHFSPEHSRRVAL
jgi:hypothetical protein